MSAPVDNLDVVHHALNMLLTSLTPAQMNNFTEQLRAAPMPTTGTATPATTSHLNQYGLVTPPNGSPTRRERLAKIKQAKMEKYKLRPLNAFMAFRSYYSSQLPGLPQKTKSGLIRQLWEQDQWKHFWAIAAKAYSELRDNHIGQITLESFLKHVTGLLGIIPADEYLATMGWTKFTDTAGQVHLLQTKAPTPKHVVPGLTSNLSVRDVVEHCYSTGLVSRGASSVRRNHSGGTRVMIPFAVAPTYLDHETTASIRNSGRFADTRVFEDLPQVVSDESVAATTTEGPVGELRTDDESVAATTTGSPVGELRTDYSPSIGVVIADQQRTLEEYPSQYPYTLHFHPDVQPVLGFDPATIQDDFDPFDVSDYINFDV